MLKPRYFYIAAISLSFLAAQSFASNMAVLDSTLMMNAGGEIGGNTNIGPMSASTVADLSTDYSKTRGGDFGTAAWWEESEQAQVTAGLGSNWPKIGQITAQATASVSGNWINAEATAWAGAILDFHVMATQTAIPPTTPSFLFVDFEASGEGSIIDGYGIYYSQAWIGASPFTVFGAPTNGDYEGGPNTDQFDKSATVQVVPNVAYTVQITAGCEAFAEMGGQFATCSASVDPTISFDQAAFDAYNAANNLPTFTLSDYYQLDHSQVSAVPEPTSLLLLGTGLGALSLAAWRRRK